MIQQHPLIHKACERPTYLKRTQAWPPKSAESLAKVPLTVDELCRFIAIEYYMGMVRLPSMVHHWSPLLLDSQVVKNIMSRDRFNAIKAMLSLESVEDTKEARDNNRHRKVGVWLDMFNERNKTVAQTYWTPEQLQSSTAIDEQSILCKSKMTAESQRMPNKPVKQGYKIFSINDSKTGYTYWFSCAMRTSSRLSMTESSNLSKVFPKVVEAPIFTWTIFSRPPMSSLSWKKWIMGVQGHGDARFLRHLRQQEKLGKSSGERFQREVIASATFRTMASPHTSGMTAGPSISSPPSTALKLTAR